jgi:acyl-coenzyme A thioesterase PaaI-like protein
MTDIDELLKILRELHEQKIPFNKFIGLRLEFVDLDIVRARFDAREEFIGNPVHDILHGGVISSVLDATGGITASLGILRRAQREPFNDIERHLTKVGTIDLRVDYLRPGS